MPYFSLMILATMLGIIVILLFLLIASKSVIKGIFGFLYKKIVLEEQSINLIRKVGLGLLVETEIRSTHGDPPIRSFSRSKIVSPWQEILFNPVYLHRLPLLDYQKVGTDVIIGEKTRYPLKLKIPILIAGMAYGTVLSAQTKQALAMGATMAGTVMNTGNGPFLPAERIAAEKLIVQYSRGHWTKDLEVLKEADAIEIQLGQGLWGPVPAELRPSRLARNPKLRRVIGVNPGERAMIPPRLLEIKDEEDLGELVESLRQKTGGIPIGIKIGATQWLERELELLVRTGPDYIAIDGVEGGTYGGLGSTLETMGTPTLYAINRARKFLERQDLVGKISLLVGGGLYTPMDFLKALALGADAVFIGTISLIALLHNQGKKLLPWEAPAKLIINQSTQKNKLNIPLAAESLSNFLKASVKEMQMAALCLGRNHLQEVNKNDLSSANQKLAKYLGIQWCGELKE